MQQLMLKWSYLLCLLLGALHTDASCIYGDCYSGKGTYLYKDGSTYKGTFLKSKPHGKGYYYQADGSVYYGDFNHGYRQGTGNMKFSTGDNYYGDFEEGKISGEGTMKYRNGDIYTGSWVNGKPAGAGKYTFSDGDIYAGNFLDGQFSGQGRLTRTDGSYYEGGWLCNKKNGKGIAFSKGNKIWQYYDMNVLLSKEQFIRKFGQAEKPLETSLDGPVKGPLKNCTSGFCHEEKGFYTYGDGSVYTGDFLNGKGEGSGECKYANGNRYTGGWRNHAPHGKGTMYFASGNIYTAYWENGSPIQKIESDAVKVIPVKNQNAKINDANDYGKTQIYALIVGVATYNHMSSLKYTDDDAYQLYAFLRSPEGGAIPDQNVKILIDDAATHQTILQELQSLIARADANDVVLLYMTGHGLDGAYVPSDFDGYKNQIPYEDILVLLNASKAKHKLFMVDACHSGSMVASARTPLNISLENFYGAYDHVNGGTALLMSSKKDEASLEYGGLRQGVFSHFLIKGLKGNADADRNKIITVSELYNFVSSNVKSYTASAQHPAIMGDYDKDMPVGMVRE